MRLKQPWIVSAVEHEEVLFLGRWRTSRGPNAANAASDRPDRRPDTAQSRRQRRRKNTAAPHGSATPVSTDQEADGSLLPTPMRLIKKMRLARGYKPGQPERYSASFAAPRANSARIFRARPTGTIPLEGLRTPSATQGQDTHQPHLSEQEFARTDVQRRRPPET